MTHDPQPKDDEIIVTVQASPGRRALGIGSLWVLAGLVFYVAIAQPPALGWQVFLIALGMASVWMAEKMRRATALRLELTGTVLRDSAGTVLLTLDDLRQIDRGMFAFKPSNGFLLKSASPGPAEWQPGLWWRTGRRIGVGGMTPGSQTKVMAEILSATIAQRDD